MGKTPFLSLDSPFLSLPHLPPHSSGHPWHPMPLPTCLLPPSTTRHEWARPLPLKQCHGSHRRALERVTVRSRTVATPSQPPPATSGLPSAPDDAPRCLRHATPLSPSPSPSGGLPHTRAGRLQAPMHGLTRASSLEASPLLPFPPLDVDRIHERSGLVHECPHGLWPRP